MGFDGIFFLWRKEGEDDGCKEYKIVEDVELFGEVIFGKFIICFELNDGCINDFIYFKLFKVFIIIFGCFFSFFEEVY